MSQAVNFEQTAARAGLERMPFGSAPEDVARIVERDGGVILTGLLTRAEVDAVNADLDPLFDALSEGNFGEGAVNFLTDFMGHRTKRLAHCLKFSRILRERFLDQEILPAYMSALMPGPVGSHTMYSSQGIEIYPGEKAQDLHRDGGGLSEVFGISHAAGPNIQINFLLALTDVTEEIGATRVIPGSHLWPDYSDMGSQDQTIPATMSAGDVMLINGKVLHGGGANRTADKSRRVLSTAFSPGIILGEEAWPHVISVDEVRDYPQRVQAYLGFRSISYRGEQPGFLWRANARPLEEHLGL